MGAPTHRLGAEAGFQHYLTQPSPQLGDASPSSRSPPARSFPPSFLYTASCSPAARQPQDEGAPAWATHGHRSSEVGEGPGA